MHIVSFIKNYFFVFLVFFAFQLSLQAKVVCMCVTTPVTFLEVIDGDTIWVKKEGKKVVVEFEGIDAPELDHKENKTQDCLHDQKIAKNLCLEVSLSTHKEHVHHHKLLIPKPKDLF